MNQPGLDNRHRDKNGRSSTKHGIPKSKHCASIMGPPLQKAVATTKSCDVLHKLDEPSLSHLIRDEGAGKLENICRG